MMSISMTARPMQVRASRTQRARAPRGVSLGRGQMQSLRLRAAETPSTTEAATEQSLAGKEEDQTVEELIAEAEQPARKAAAAAKVTDPSKLFMGLDGSQGVFGFTPFAEMFVGRAAMLGFASAMTVELATGGSGGALAQLGLMVDGEANVGLATAIASVAGAATLIGTFQTFAKAQGKELTPAQVDGYRRFLNLREPEEVEAEEAAVRAMSSDMQNLIYARGVEISNGRWAMIGFLWAIVAEAATGHGIVFQLVDYARMAGLLGENSGF